MDQDTFNLAVIGGFFRSIAWSVTAIWLAYIAKETLIAIFA